MRDAYYFVSGHDKPGHSVGAAGRPTPQVRMKQGPDPTLPGCFSPDGRRYAVLIFNILGKSEPYADDTRECGIEGACGKIGREWEGGVHRVAGAEAKLSWPRFAASGLGPVDRPAVCTLRPFVERRRKARGLENETCGCVMEGTAIRLEPRGQADGLRRAKKVKGKARDTVFVTRTKDKRTLRASYRVVRPRKWQCCCSVGSALHCTPRSLCLSWCIIQGQRGLPSIYLQFDT